jgi:arylsulfatase A-like enzyme
LNSPNVLLVILDATRQDACSCYGGRSNTTPTLDELAQEGTRFDNAFTVAPWTFPSLASMFTGRYPSQTGVYVQRKLSDQYPTLAELLRSSGYATFAISDNPWMSAEFGLTRGFDRMHKLWQWWQTDRDINNITLSDVKHTTRLMAVARLMAEGNPLKNTANVAYYRLVRPQLDYGASRTLRPLRRWIEDQRTPWFAFVHYLEAHMNYKPPRAWRERFVTDRALGEQLAGVDQWRLARRHLTGVERLSEIDLRTLYELYLAEIAYADHHLGQLIGWLRQTRRLDNTLVIVLADHGESFGEHNMLEHQFNLYDSLLRIPLIVRYPAQFPAGQRVIELVESLDVFATALEAADLPIGDVASRSLRPGHSAPRTHTYAEYGVPRMPHLRWLQRFGLEPAQLEPFQVGFTAIRTDTRKLIVGTDQSLQLYDWRADRAEAHNLIDVEPETVESLLSDLEVWWQASGSGLAGDPAQMSIMNPQVEARLRALGYLD